MHNHYQKRVEIDDYIKNKIRMIEKHFKIRLTEDEKEHMECLTCERDVDQYAHDIFMRKL